MLETIVIISKILNALMPCAWLIFFWLIGKKGKCEKTFAILSLYLIIMGIITGVADGADLICILLGWD